MDLDTGQMLVMRLMKDFEVTQGNYKPGSQNNKEPLKRAQ